MGFAFRELLLRVVVTSAPGYDRDIVTLLVQFNRQFSEILASRSDVRIKTLVEKENLQTVRREKLEAKSCSRFCP